MKRFFLTLPLCALLIGCTTVPSGKTVTIPVPPAFTFADDSKVYTSADLYTAVLTEILLAGTYTQIEYTDATFITVDYNWLDELSTFSRTLETALGIFYLPDGFDCDKFALGYCFLANLSAQHDGIKHQPLVFRIFVNQIKPWGGVPAGGNHALVAALTNKGLVVIEPQSKARIPFKDYPNKTSVYVIRIGG